MRCAPLVGTAHPVRPLRRPTSASARVRHSRSSLCLKYGPLESALFKNKETRPSAPTRPLRSPPGRSQRTDHHLGRLARFVFERGAPLFRSTPTTAPRLTARGSQGCIKDAFFSFLPVASGRYNNNIPPRRLRAEQTEKARPCCWTDRRARARRFGRHPTNGPFAGS